jgi:hypothetical protein
MAAQMLLGAIDMDAAHFQQQLLGSRRYTRHCWKLGGALLTAQLAAA